MQEMGCLVVQMIGQTIGTALAQGTPEIGTLRCDLTDMRVQKNVRNPPARRSIRHDVVDGHGFCAICPADRRINNHTSGRIGARLWRDGKCGLRLRLKRCGIVRDRELTERSQKARAIRRAQTVITYTD